jgi:hypothetical protein
MRVVLLILTLFCFSMQAQEVGKNIVTGSAQGREIVQEQANEGYDPHKNDENYRREAVYNWYLLYKGTNQRTAEYNTASLIKIRVENITNIANSSTANNATVTVKGYCIVRDDIHIAEQPASISLDCDTNIGVVEIFANLVPQNKVSTLLLDPIFLDYKKYRYTIVKSYVTNEAKTSYNIATFVNSRKLEKLAYSSLSVATDEVKTASNAYLQALQQARESTNLGYQTIGNSSDLALIQTSNVEKPQPSDYFITAGINTLASVVKATARVMQEDLPYLYEVVKGSKIYVDMQVNDKGEPL